MRKTFYFQCFQTEDFLYELVTQLNKYLFLSYCGRRAMKLLFLANLFSKMVW